MVKWIVQFVRNMWFSIADMAPFLLVGFAMAGVMSVFVSRKFVERHLGKRGWFSVLEATILGIPLPLCSCSVIPVSMSLRRHGASRGATLAFLLSAPQTGVDSIAATFSLLGPVMAVFRPLLALVTGLIGGGLADWLVRDSDPAQTQTDTSCRGGHCLCSEQLPGQWTRAFRYAFITLPRDIGRPLALGLVVAALIATCVPNDFFAAHVGTGWRPMLLMLVLGIPMYVCATASVPMAAAMILKGLSPGAALVFLMTGPVTNAAGLVTVWKTLGTRTALIYCGTVVLCALAGGLLLDQLAASISISNRIGMGTMQHPVVKHLSAVGLIVMMVSAVINKDRGSQINEEQGIKNEKPACPEHVEGKFNLKA